MTLLSGMVLCNNSCHRRRCCAYRLKVVKCFVQVIGSPSEEDIAFVSSDKARRYLRSLPPCPRADFRKLYPHADEQVRRGAVPYL